MNSIERGIRSGVITLSLLATAGGAGSKIDSSAQQADPQIGGHNPPYSKFEIQTFYDDDYLHSPECDIMVKAQAAGGTTVQEAQACVNVMNKCNGNAQKQEDQKQTGCFDGWQQDPQTGGYMEKLTGFTVELKPAADRTPWDWVQYNPIPTATPKP